ncbi:hypothetical protein N0V90_011595 [Kalmusia sp. IMI 367209]|nr:hypothetical protein N0V90_011595 [Kalmusia sp. IMI 367209]
MVGALALGAAGQTRGMSWLAPRPLDGPPQSRIKSAEQLMNLPLECATAAQICDLNCCDPDAWQCVNGQCVLATGQSTFFPSIGTFTPSHTDTTTVATGPVSSVTVSTSVTTIVSSVNSTSSASATASKTDEHSHPTSASAIESNKPKPTGAAAMLVPGSGILGVAVAAALGVM